MLDKQTILEALMRVHASIAARVLSVYPDAKLYVSLFGKEGITFGLDIPRFSAHFKREENIIFDMVFMLQEKEEVYQLLHDRILRSLLDSSIAEFTDCKYGVMIERTRKNP